MMTALTIPDGLILDRLPEASTARHAEARSFCLDVIKEFYGFNYRPDWHEDLDSLCRPAEKNHYSSANTGGFWMLSEPNGALVATAGVRSMRWKPRILEAYAARYPVHATIGSLWRVYVRSDHRRRGLGRWLNRLAEIEAHTVGYREMYLHTSSDATATIAFWKSCGYRAFDERDDTVHMDKRLGAGAADR